MEEGDCAALGETMIRLYIIERENRLYTIRHGNSYFSFFVGDDRSSWTSRSNSAKKYSSLAEARAELAEINRRNAKRQREWKKTVPPREKGSK
jgi:hypothetical protein